MTPFLQQLKSIFQSFAEQMESCLLLLTERDKEPQAVPRSRCGALQRSGEKHNIALHSNNPRMKIPSGASHPSISCITGVCQGFRSEVCAPGEVLEDTHSPHSVHSWPPRDVLVSAGVPQPQGFLCAVFLPLVIPGKQTLPAFTWF